MLVRRAHISPPPDEEAADADRWPFTIPAVAAIATESLRFDLPITFLVGENGSGKSTIVEALAESFGLDSRGGRAGRKYGNARPKTLLGEAMRIETTAAGARMRAGPRTRRRGYFLRAETAFGFMEAVRGRHGYWTEDTSEQSHGEGFLTVLDAMLVGPGFYVMDEPEAALSFASCLQLVASMTSIADSGGQVVCATHSPLLAATPNAEIIEVGEHGLSRQVPWESLQLVDHWRRFLSNPARYLDHLA